QRFQSRELRRIHRQSQLAALWAGCRGAALTPSAVLLPLHVLVFKRVPMAVAPVIGGVQAALQSPKLSDATLLYGRSDYEVSQHARDSFRGSACRRLDDSIGKAATPHFARCAA